MRTTLRVLLGVMALSAVPAGQAADPEDVGRTLKQQPAYRTKAPRYCLLVFGPEARERVWLVHDGDTLYVDRDGDGDLTQRGKKVTAETVADGGELDRPYKFNVGELHVGGRVHKGLEVWTSLLTRSNNSIESSANAKAALAADLKARVYSITLDVDWPGMKGQGLGGRVLQQAGPRDVHGALLFADRPGDAPVIHFGGPLRVTFEAAPPVLKLGRENAATLIVGTPGRGPGTFAMLGYEGGAIPDAVVPAVEATFPAARPGGPPVRVRYELKERC